MLFILSLIFLTAGMFCDIFEPLYIVIDMSFLSELCESASCGEVFLLASAALANITFFDSMACEILLQLNAIQILLQACKDRQRVDTPYSKDQVGICKNKKNRRESRKFTCFDNQRLML